MSAETERIGHDNLNLTGDGLSGHEVPSTGNQRVEMIEVYGGVYQTVAHRAEYGHALDGRTGTEQMTSHGLGRRRLSQWRGTPTGHPKGWKSRAC